MCIRDRYVALVRSWLRGVRLGVTLDHILAVLKPIVDATVHQHAGHVFVVEYEHAIVPDADRVSDLFVCLPRNRLDDSLVHLHAESPHASVSFDIRWSGGKRSC